MDETYIKVKSNWVYLYRAVDKEGQTIDFMNGMRGFKAFHSAEATLSGIELHHMLRKNQHTQSSNMTIFEQFYGLAA
jgi:putative transposase